MPSTIAPFFVTPAELCLAYAEALLKDIPAEKFAFMPHPTLNHPAFNIGHLSMYPNRMLNLLGRPDLVKEKPGWDKLFPAGIECVSEAGRYPTKQEIEEHYFERHRAVLPVVLATSDADIAKPNPMEGRMRELFPTLGMALNFMLNNHQMMHLGQISAWRRAVGLGSAM